MAHNQSTIDIIQYLSENFSVGDKLPSERDMADLVGYSRAVIREVSKQLELFGFLNVEHGKPKTLVKNPKDFIESVKMQIVLPGNELQIKVQGDQIVVFSDNLWVRAKDNEQSSTQDKIIHRLATEVLYLRNQLPSEDNQ